MKEVAAGKLCGHHKAIDIKTRKRMIELSFKETDLKDLTRA
jgi:hypothetical protein